MKGRKVSSYNRRVGTGGISLVEVMIGVTIFASVAVAVGGLFKHLTQKVQDSQMQDQAAKYLLAEAQRVERIARLPERTSSGQLVYRNASGSIVSSGGSLVPFGYTNYLTSNELLKSSPNNPKLFTKVVYPDILAGFLEAQDDLNRITLLRSFQVTTFNANSTNDDEYKQITITLKDPNINEKRMKDQSMTITVKKPHPLALDTRMAKGMADLTGIICDKITRMPITPSGQVTARLDSRDGSVRRYSGADDQGRFYFSPPLPTSVGWDLTITDNNHWSRTIPVNLVPGTNHLVGDDGEVAYVAPYIKARVSVVVTDAETMMALNQATVYVFHRNYTAPYGPWFYSAETDVTGTANFEILIPVAEATTYSNFILAYVGKTGYITYYNDVNIANGPGILDLSATTPLTKNIAVYPYRTGALNVTVLKAPGMLNNKAQVSLGYVQDNYWVYTSMTDDSGLASFPFLPINDTANPSVTFRTWYIQATLPNHLVHKTSVLVNANETKDISVQMAPHSMYWADSVGSFGVGKGFSNWIQAKAFYEGYQGRGVTDVARGPNPYPFAGEQVTSGGFPGTFVWSGYDPSIIAVSDNPAGPDTKTISGLAVGNTQINVQATFSYYWNGNPYSLTINRTYAISVTDGNSNYSVGINPKPSRHTPNTSLTYRVDEWNSRPDNLTFTWTVTGPGAVQVEYLNSQGQVTSNGTSDTRQCRVLATAVNPENYVISVKAVSVPANVSVGDSANILVAYSPLSVTLNPTGTYVTQPGYTKTISAAVSGGSGQYTYLWEILNINTGLPDTFIGSLSGTTGASTIFSASQVGSTNVKVTVTDTLSNAQANRTLRIDVQPEGGLTQ